jgi:hypothetical protein
LPLQSNSGHHPIPLFWYHGNAILNFINTPKASTHYSECFMKFDERNKKKIKIPPLFISMATAAKFVLPIPIFLAYLVPLDVDVTGNIIAKICKV